MLKKLKQRQCVLVGALIIGALFAVSSATYAVEAKPGDIIDSSNIEQYKEYFPMYMQRYIKDGWEFEKPVVIKVKVAEPVPLTKSFLKASQDNMKTLRVNSRWLVGWL